MTPCMGGWCAVREKCPHYTSPTICRPSERLCIDGRDGWQYSENAQGNAEYKPVFLQKTDGDWLGDVTR